MSRYLDPKSDLVFKKIFGEHPLLLKSFLNAVLPLPLDGLIESLDYLPTEQVPTIPMLKNSIVDVKCTDQQGRVFIVEMQLDWTAGFMQRMLFNASKAYLRQLEKKETYDSLSPVYGLGLLGCTFDKETEDWYHHYKIVNIQRPERELKGLQLIFIELPKFQPATFTERKLQVLWLRFLSEVDEKSRTIAPELLEIPEINQAISLAEESSYTPAELAAYDKYWDTVRTEKTLMAGRYNEGREEGIAEGVEKGIAEGVEKGIAEGMEKGIAEGIHQGEVAILKRQLARRFGSLDSSFLEQLEKASPEQLWVWVDRVLEAKTLPEVFKS
jgi:predicted transposase/invertase (TIGR01784 family)